MNNIAILLLWYKCYDLISAGDFAWHGSTGDLLRKQEFPGQNGKVGTYETVDQFPKTDFLIHI